ncbi:MAG: SUMF1/EgtB/PvdO family nonheme iron enzyme [Ignavibacteriae bacterium]|nr:SUMF1/EgtB/PvdO family nonheme iron enzyme [Ignavibacteriota bacterium]
MWKKDTLENGIGFWIKFDSSETIPISGNIIFDDSIEVVEGWNLIGSLSVPIAVSTIKTEPMVLITSEFWGYVPGIGYQQSDTLQPGHGYWIKANQNGVIMLPSDSVKTIVPENTIVVNDTTYNENLIGISPDSTQFIFNPTFDSLYPLQIGDVMVNTNGEGMLRKVTNIQRNEDSIIVTTTSATLTDAIARGEGSFLDSLTVDNIDTINYFVQGLKLKVKPGNNIKGIDAINFDFDTVVFYDDDGDLDTKFDQIRTTGNFEIGPIVRGTVKLDWFTLEKLELEYQFVERLNQQLEIGLIDYSLEKETTIVTIEFKTFKIMVGYVPVLIKPILNIKVGSEINVNSSITTGVHQEYTYTAGLRYEDELWTTYANKTSLFENEPPTLSGSLNAKVYIKPELEFKIYGTLSPYLYGELYAELGADVAESPWWELYAGLDLGAGVRMSIFDEELFDYYGQLIELRMKIAEASGAFDLYPDEPTLLSPENNAIDISTTRELTWNASNKATSYTLQVSADSSFANFVYNQSGLTDTMQQVTGLNNLTKYYWRVGATNSFGTSGWSTKWIFTTIGLPPSAPILITPSNNAVDVSTIPELVWNIGNSATSYTLQISTDSLFSTFAYNQNGLTDTSQQVNELSNSTKYYWRVSASNSYGTSGWSNVWSFTTTTSGGGTPCPSTPTVTYEGKTYNTVQVGAQCWFKENLDVGTMITGSLNQTNTGTIEKFCYNNDTTKCSTYGGLYQWNEAMQYSTTAGAQGICPTGWHIPTYAELLTLKATVNNDGNALKAVGQGTGGGEGTNTSGFSALIAGYRNYDGGFYFMGQDAQFWSSSINNTTNSFHLYLTGQSSIIALTNNSKDFGFSIRCLKDISETNNPPNQPSNPIPSDSETNVTTSPTLRWSCNDPDGDTLTYDVYFGTDHPPATKVSSGQSDTSFNCSILDTNRTYYWNIIAKDSNGDSTISVIWSFTTSTIVAPEMIQITGGWIGTDVQISNFSIDRYEITFELWNEVRSWGLLNGYTDLNPGRNGKNGTTNHPVTEVTWYDMIKWCNARSEKNGLMQVYYTNSSKNIVYRTSQIDISNDAVDWSANGFRLPTETEWHFAAMGGNQTHNYLYSGSDTIGNVAWYDNNSSTNTHPVGQKQANELGIYDMSGNVFEMCWDWYSTTFPMPGINPKGPTSGTHRVVRGGQFLSPPVYCRVNYRTTATPSSNSYSNSFRCVKK